MGCSCRVDPRRVSPTGVDDQPVRKSPVRSSHGKNSRRLEQFLCVLYIGAHRSTRRPVALRYFYYNLLKSARVSADRQRTERARPSYASHNSVAQSATVSELPPRRTNTSRGPQPWQQALQQHAIRR